MLPLFIHFMKKVRAFVVVRFFASGCFLVLAQMLNATFAALCAAIMRLFGH